MQTQPPQSPPSRRGVRPFLAVPLVLLVVVLAAYLATRPLGNEPQPSFFVIGSAGPGVRIGEVAPGTTPGGPGLALTDPDGKAVDLGAFRGHPLWLVFWKTACQPCEAEAPDVAAAYAEHRAEGLMLLGIDVWDTAAAVKDSARGQPLPYPIAVASSTAVIDAYGVWGAPTHYFIGADGIIRDRYFGPMTASLIARSLGTIVSPGSP
jgi:peroxiredoxin